MIQADTIIRRLRALAAEFNRAAYDERPGSYFDGMRSASQSHAQQLQLLIDELEQCR